MRAVRQAVGRIGPQPSLRRCSYRPRRGLGKYPNGGVDYRIRNIFTVSTPFFAKTLKDCEWLRDEDDITESQCIEIFPDIPKEILSKGQTGDQSGLRAQYSPAGLFRVRYPAQSLEYGTVHPALVAPFVPE